MTSAIGCLAKKTCQQLAGELVTPQQAAFLPREGREGTVAVFQTPSIQHNRLLPSVV